jgi:hypothetical protein
VISFQTDTIGTLFVLFNRKKTIRICFLIAHFRLQDVFRVSLHLDCFLELVLGVEPATMGVVSILLADGTRDDDLGYSSFTILLQSSPFAIANITGSSDRSSSGVRRTVVFNKSVIKKNRMFNKSVVLVLYPDGLVSGFYMHLCMRT